MANQKHTATTKPYFNPATFFTPQLNADMDSAYDTVNTLLEHAYKTQNYKALNKES